METTVIDSSAEADEDDYFVLSSQKQTKADSKENLEVIQFLNVKNKSLSLYISVPLLYRGTAVHTKQHSRPLTIVIVQRRYVK